MHKTSQILRRVFYHEKLKKYVRTVSAALCSLLLLSSAPALADTYATVRGGGLNLRQTASLDGTWKVLGQYPYPHMGDHP